MPIIDANGIKICVQTDGANADPAVLLLHGLGCQLIQWPDTWVSSNLVSRHATASRSGASIWSVATCIAR